MFSILYLGRIVLIIANDHKVLSLQQISVIIIQCRNELTADSPDKCAEFFSQISESLIELKTSNFY